jgi:hypothetical protein
MVAGGDPEEGEALRVGILDFGIWIEQQPLILDLGIWIVGEKSIEPSA